MFGLVLQIEDGVLASFSASLGVTSYRQLQEQVEAAKAKREEALGAINAKCAQLVQQVCLKPCPSGSSVLLQFNFGWTAACCLCICIVVQLEFETRERDRRAKDVTDSKKRLKVCEHHVCAHRWVQCLRMLQSLKTLHCRTLRQS